MVGNQPSYEQDSAHIVVILREGIDYSKISGAMIALMQLIEESRENKDWNQCRTLCKQLDGLSEDLDMKRLPDVDAEYVAAIGQVCRGVTHLCQCATNITAATEESELDNAIQCFSAGQHLFQDAEMPRSEAVALFALGVSYQAQALLYRRTGNAREEDSWLLALQTLQASLAVFRNLEDSRRFDARHRFARVREQWQKLPDTGRAEPPTPPSPRPPVPKFPLRRVRPWTGDLNQAKKVPIVALVKAGEPSLPDDDIEGYVIVDNEIGKHTDFAVKVQGDSMTGVDIEDGDAVLIQRRQDLPPNGQIAIVIVPRVGGEATLKRFYDEADYIRLEPANESYPPILVTSSTSETRGVQRYKQENPGKLCRVYLDTVPEVVGWARAVIKKEDL